jgi:PadR family transcriptional regulator
MDSTKSPDLLQGTLDMMILRTLSLGPDHGYGVSRRIRQASGEVLQVEEGSLYPALHRLERKGLLASQWRQSESNRRAKYYRLTAKGRQRLKAERAAWFNVSAAVGRVMGVSRTAVAAGNC